MASKELLEKIEADPFGGDFTTAPQGLSAFEQAGQEGLSLGQVGLAFLIFLSVLSLIGYFVSAKGKRK